MLIKIIERSLVYPVPSRQRGDWKPRWLRPQNVWFRSKDETKLHGWYIPNPDARRLVVYCHPNGEHVADQANLMCRLQSLLQATLFVFDYRGYGRSRGKPFERGCIADGMAAQHWLADREGVATDEIVLMGRSIGGAVAVAMAAEQGAKALVLEHTFSRMTDAARALYPYFPVNWFMRNRYNSVKRIRRFDGPVFQCHGASDEVVPIRLARKLHASIPGETKQFYEIANGRHNDTLPPRYYEALAQFLDRVDAAAETPVHVPHGKRQLVS